MVVALVVASVGGGAGGTNTARRNPPLRGTAGRREAAIAGSGWTAGAASLGSLLLPEPGCPSSACAVHVVA